LEFINTCSKEAGYKINIQKSVTFLCRNKEQSEKETRKTIPVRIALKTKTPRTKFNEECKRPTNHQRKKSKDTGRWKDSPGSWSSRTDIVKMAALPKEVNMFMQHPSQSQ
jgi:hypothetical protein